MKRRVFSLVELLAVMAIIAILAGLIIAGSSSVRRRQRESAARATLQQLEVALDQYQQEWGHYPYPRDEIFTFCYKVNDNGELYFPGDGVDSDGDGEADDSWGSVYAIREKSGLGSGGDSDGDGKADDQTAIRNHRSYAEPEHAAEDAWGKPFFYKCPGTMNPDSYDLWSLGPDTHPGVRGEDANDLDASFTTQENNDITNWKQR